MDTSAVGTGRWEQKKNMESLSLNEIENDLYPDPVSMPPSYRNIRHLNPTTDRLIRFYSYGINLADMNLAGNSSCFQVSLLTTNQQ